VTVHSSGSRVVSVLRRMRFDEGAGDFANAFEPLADMTQRAAGLGWQVCVRSVSDTAVFFHLTAWESVASFRNLARQRQMKNVLRKMGTVRVDFGTVADCEIIHYPSVLSTSPGFLLMLTVSGPEFDGGTVQRIHSRLNALASRPEFGGSAILRTRGAAPSQRVLCWLHVPLESEASWFADQVHVALAALPRVIVSDVVISRHVSWFSSGSAENG
jgi:heme-degrading monooxygenase HmoA